MAARENQVETISIAQTSRPQALSSEIARQLLVTFATICQKEITNALVRIWDEQLSDIEPGLLKCAGDRLLKKWTSGFLPVPGNVREEAEQLRELAESDNERKEQKNRALIEHERAIEHAERIRHQGQLRTDRGFPGTSTKKQLATPPLLTQVVDIEDRRNELRAQAETILKNYPSRKGDVPDQT